MESKICVDASLALKLVLPESDSDLAQTQWQTEAGVEIISPDLFVSETTSVLRNRVYRKEMTQSEADEALRILESLESVIINPREFENRVGSWHVTSIVLPLMTRFILLLHKKRVPPFGPETDASTMPSRIS